MSTQQIAQQPEQSREQRDAQLSRLVQRLHINNNIAVGILWVVAAIVAVIFVSVIVYLLIKGLAYFINPAFYDTSSAGVGREIFNTFYVLILTEILLIPVALAAAIYLNEYARQGLLVTAIHFAAETLAGVPTIVLGLFGFLIFSSSLHLGFSRLAGALTLLCLGLPLGLRLFEDALVSVPRELREGGLALGATKWHVIRTVVIPSALPGIITGLILTAGRIVGEAAALLFTMGLTSPPNVFTASPFIASDTLTTHLYFIAGPGAGSTGLSTAQETAISAGSSALLIALLLIINLGARGLGRIIQRRITAA
ncbi:MAG: phosphate ABC transporter permease PstA [Ktedonobacteraceae bacterium]